MILITNISTLLNDAKRDIQDIINKNNAILLDLTKSVDDVSQMTTYIHTEFEDTLMDYNKKIEPLGIELCVYINLTTFIKEKYIDAEVYLRKITYINIATGEIK